jgi:hypothetical protein
MRHLMGDDSANCTFVENDQQWQADGHRNVSPEKPGIAALFLDRSVEIGIDQKSAARPHKCAIELLPNRPQARGGASSTSVFRFLRGGSNRIPSASATAAGVTESTIGAVANAIIVWRSMAISQAMNTAQANATTGRTA